MNINVLSFYKRHIRIVPGVSSYIIATGIVFALGMVITLLSWQIDRQRAADSQADRLSQQSAMLEDNIRNKLDIYEQIIRGASGLFGSSEQVTKSEWERFFQQYDLKNSFPGITGIGYAKYVPYNDTATYVQAIKAEYGFDDSFKIMPDGTRTDYAPITYTVPPSQTGNKFIGYDVLSSPERKTAAETARDTGKVGITEKLQLLSDKSNNLSNASFAMYVAAYRNNVREASVDQRRENLTGYIYAAYRAKDFFGNAVDTKDFQAYSGVQIFDGSSADDNALMYQSSNFASVANKKMTTPRTVTVFDHPWTYRFAGPIDFNNQDRQRSDMILFGGTIISLAIAGFLFLVMLTRARDIVYSKQKEAQQAKDDLLSLASHQLRTPATAVKQYLGMILEGYTGKVDKKQLPALQKAYASNERQLETINQILYVAKADAGRLSINKSDFDLNILIEDIILELEDTFQEKGQKIAFDPSSKKLKINADEASLRMVIENLISNASKYSYDKATVTVRTYVRDHKAWVSVTDEGIGIAPDDFDKLFKKFSRIDNDLSLQVGGSGIGLYIDKVLVELHGGTIHAESKLNEGSTFTVSLPRKSESNLTDGSNKNGRH